MSGKLRPLGALLGVALISAGCSHASGKTSTDTHNDAASSSSTAAHEMAMEFSRCMRDNGVSGFRTRTRRASSRSTGS